MRKKELDVKILFLNKHNTKNNSFRLHNHNCYEIVFFLEGSGKVIIGDKECYVEADAYCIIAPETPHIECIEGYGEIAFIGFEQNGYSLQEGVYHDRRRVLPLFDGIFEEYKKQAEGFEAATEAYLTLLLLDAVRNDTAAENKCKDLNFIKNYIEQHFDQKIDFASLASLAGYSTDYFRHIFRERFGVSPQQYMIDIRLKKADEMLRKTDKTCTEIALYCGFSNSGQMSVMYKKRFGVSPSDVKI